MENPIYKTDESRATLVEVEMRPMESHWLGSPLALEITLVAPQGSKRSTWENWQCRAGALAWHPVLQTSRGQPQPGHWSDGGTGHREGE